MTPALLFTVIVALPWELGGGEPHCVLLWALFVDMVIFSAELGWEGEIIS